MDKNQISASGERAAMGGYSPQFSEFAWFVYKELINENLKWIRIADPEAEKIDDIQYCTDKEIHAYQVKWTIANDNISFADFKNLLPLIVKSWKGLKDFHVAENKKIIAHLLTNKALSSNDTIKSGDVKLGSFTDFYNNVWVNINDGKNYDPKWNEIIKDLSSLTNLSEIEFNEFVKNNFQFHPNHQAHSFTVVRSNYSKQDKDLNDLKSFIIEKVAHPNREVHFTAEEIINSLGWEDRFKTSFNHELFIDYKRYQPINSSLIRIDNVLSQNKGGYIFLVGGPGTGKSTLLTHWAKNKEDRIVKYYAFDFTNPSNWKNYYERGDSTSLYFDLVFQLKREGIYDKDILPYKHLSHLKEVFHEQIEILGNDFKKTGKRTVLIIDGLDHVPREYTNVSKSFLMDLPKPSSLPDGVYIILGSQSFELEDIGQEIKSLWKAGKRNILIEPLNFDAVNKYLESSEISLQLTEEIKIKIFEKSEGHPLYLSYLIEKLKSSTITIDIIEAFVTINGNIEEYYRNIWHPIEKEADLIKLLGLVSRINGSINPSFVNEWGFDLRVLKMFNEKAKFLFSQSAFEWSFFHNSFRLFLLKQTCYNYLLEKYDTVIELEYHKRLSDFYSKSEVEPYWRKFYHLYKLGDTQALLTGNSVEAYKEFLEIITPNLFVEQLLQYRPIEEIKRDAKLCIEIARKTNDLYTLIRYLLVLAEFERRASNVDPVTFANEFLMLGKPSVAKNYIRSGVSLNCSKVFALKAVKYFIDYNDKVEAALLFKISEPDIIEDSSIVINDSHRIEDVKEILDAWIQVAPCFLTIPDILVKVNNIKFIGERNLRDFDDKESDLRIRLLKELSYSLIVSNKWKELNILLEEFKTDSKDELNWSYHIIIDAIEQCEEINDNDCAKRYLTLLLSKISKDTLKPIGRIYIADLISKVTNNIDLAIDWINGISQPTTVGEDRMGYEGSLATFIPLIKFNKVLNLAGKGVAVNVAIPSVDKGADEEIIVEFERMLCLITQILTDGILKIYSYQDITKRIRPIVHFYYKEVSIRDKYWYRLTQCKEEYFDFLIYATSKNGLEYINQVAEYLFREFSQDIKYWPSKLQRKIIESLFDKGYDVQRLKIQLQKLEPFMLEGRDIDGRIRECIAHSKAWLHLGEVDIAEKWIKQTIQESIGIGYRKDYQFNTWIEWLQKINSIRPDKGSEHIKWFLSHLSHIKESTEGRAYWHASEALLQSAFMWNFSAGVDQLKWQLDEGLVSFEDAVTTFLVSYFEASQSEDEFKAGLRIHTEIVLYISASDNIHLLNQILKTGHLLFQRSFFEIYIPQIIDSINTKSLEEKRFGLLSAIEDFAKTHDVSLSDYCLDFRLPENHERNNSSNYSSTLKLKNHEILTKEQVLDRVSSYLNLKCLIQDEDQDNSYFNWTEAIKKIADILTIEEVKDLAKLKRTRKESEYFSDLSRLALQLGDRNLAINFANQAIELSSESGWVSNYDGGTRRNAFSALKKIDSIESAKKAFDVFSNDVISGNYPSFYIESLEEIVPLIVENYDVEKIWLELFNYLKRLMSNSSPKQNLPKIEYQERPINNSMVDLLFYFSKSPVSIIKEAARRLLAMHISTGDKYSINHLKDLSAGSETEVEIVNDVLMFLLAFDSKRINEFKTVALQFSVSENYLIRSNAKKLLSVLNENIPEPVKRKLPDIYSLHFNSPPKLEIKKELDPFNPTIDINDPQDLIRPFEPFVNIISKISQIDESILFYRMSQIMKKNGDPLEWTIEYEKTLRGHLEEISLEYAYPRPRVIAARRALMVLIGELIDSDSIQKASIETIGRLAMSYDYSASFFREHSKPNFIQTLKTSEDSSVDKDWIEKVKENQRLNEGLVEYNSESKIIGEYSLIRSLNWGTATEIFMSQLAFNDVIKKNNDGYIFGSTFQTSTDEYYTLSDLDDYIVILREHRFGQFDMKSRWIAMNPIIANHLGWKPDKNRLFGWKDEKGRFMAESIFWSNGNIDMRPPHLYSESGEGWFVIVSQMALSQIEELGDKFFIQKSLKRSKWEDSKFEERSSMRSIAYN
jgi:hypothetical protein